MTFIIPLQMMAYTEVDNNYEKADRGERLVRFGCGIHKKFA